MTVPIEQMSLEELRADPRYPTTDGTRLSGEQQQVVDRALALERAAADAERLAELQPAVSGEGIDGSIGHALGQLPRDLVDRLDAAGAHADPAMIEAARELGSYVQARRALPASTRQRYRDQAASLMGEVHAALARNDHVAAKAADAKAAGIYRLLAALP